MGVSWIPSLEAWNFVLYSRRATGVTLLLYSSADPVKPLLEYRLDVRANKSGRIWHCWIPLTTAPRAAYYAWRVEGRDDHTGGFRFDRQKILLDPFAPAVYTFRRITAARPPSIPGRTTAARPLGVLPARRVARPRP